MFKQAERSTDGRNSGLGLGLALVKTLVEAHHGTISGFSDGPGCGSRFEARLPKAILSARN
jgi:signal transduction histidine kinase